MIKILSGSRTRALIAIPLFSLMLMGCSQQFALLGQTMKLAIWGQDDTDLTPQQVAKVPYASAYIKVGEAPRAFMVLAFAENGLLKWVAADKNMVATHDGRVVKTQGFGEDIQHVANQEHDPLHLGLLKAGTPMRWQTEVSWSQVMRGSYELQSSFENRGREPLVILGRTYQTVRFDELVTVPALNKRYTNQYWVNASTGQVMQSRQYMGPDMALVQFTALKSYAQSL